jgi:hypothetical protein|tara:strand:+ start:820 stop:942 length:123 start_codon:yes stop_codon:yes gene_type:complete
MTVSRLRQELTNNEFIYFAAYYQNKGEKEKREFDKAKRSR